MCDNILCLNVGGVHYTTTKETLCKYPNSMLGAMFNGCIPTTKDSEGRYFIDRDGSLFVHILNYLRSARLALPDGFKHLDPLAVEADYFQIEPLIYDIGNLRQKAKKEGLLVGQLVEVIEVRTGSTATMPTNNSRVKTIISGRCDTISSLPSQFVGPVEKLHHLSDKEFTELELSGSNVRLKLAEYLQSNGWKLIDSNLSSSSGYDAKSMISSLIIEQSYRDRWFKPEDEVNGMDT